MSGLTNQFRLFFITNQPDIAAFVAQQGVARIFVDLEYIGKDTRQGHLSTVKNFHTIQDVALVKAACSGVEVMARINPLHADTETEIEGCVSAGANILMLPMYKTSAEVLQVSKFIAGRARLCLLAETPEALENMPEIAALGCVDEVHFGLNDLCIARSDKFMFQILVQGELDAAISALRQYDVPFGIGGVARHGEGLLPAELLLGEHVRLGSTAAILSRTFHRGASTVQQLLDTMDVGREIGLLHSAYDYFLSAGKDELSLNQREVRRRVESIVKHAGQ